MPGILSESAQIIVVTIFTSWHRNSFESTIEKSFNSKPILYVNLQIIWIGFLSTVNIFLKMKIFTFDSYGQEFLKIAKVIAVPESTTDRNGIIFCKKGFVRKRSS
jgi:hypothetical protein